MESPTYSNDAHHDLNPTFRVLDEEIITPEEWIHLARTENSKISRRRFLKYYAKANCRQSQHLRYCIKSDGVSTGKRDCTKDPANARSSIRPFWMSASETTPTSRRSFERSIPRIKVYILVSKKIPKIEPSVLHGPTGNTAISRPHRAFCSAECGSERS